MSSPRPLEEQILEPAQGVLDAVAQTNEERLEVLEAAASRAGEFSLDEYRVRFETGFTLTKATALEAGTKLLQAINATSIPPALALSALARPRLEESEQRSSGAYYTDFRLARHLAADVTPHLRKGAKIIDPAAGTGILLVAASLAACGGDPSCRASWLAESVTAWDLSSVALRGARLALAALTNDLGAVEKMVSRWRSHDSLLAKEPSLGSFDVVLGNPPWEKIKVTRHEFLKANGQQRHYGSDYEDIDNDLFASRKTDTADYGKKLASRYLHLGSGEPDLYKAFLELFVTLAAPEGRVSVLVPAGLIRSQGTEGLRRFLMENSSALSFTIMENRARFFSIDTRFKFLGVSLTKRGPENKSKKLGVIFVSGKKDGLTELGRTDIERSVLERVRPDLTIPEIRSKEEWMVFRKMSESGDASILWQPEIVRELDMTRDRGSFSTALGKDRLALIEGRMVHQHRFGAKVYCSGTGRRARWDTVPLGQGKLTPQFWFPRAKLPSTVRVRTQRIRAGFCDITGQTNERSMLATIIPEGVVCGNKVPTVTFPNDPSEERLHLWTAVVNSFTFDWALRRILTTTVNFFLLKSVPFPALQPTSIEGREIVALSKELNQFDRGFGSRDPWRIAEIRCAIDVAVHAAYGLKFEELELIFKDFPLLDRGQPPIDSETHSTVTRDFVLARASEYFRKNNNNYNQRWQAARKRGAIPYIPADYASPLPLPTPELSYA